MGSSTSENETKIALISGGSRGIGRAVCLRLARDGFDIWLNYRSNNEAAEQTAKEIEALGRQCKPLAFDVANTRECEMSLSPLLEKECPYALINNAGITRDGLLALMSESDWDSVINTTLKGFFNLSRICVSAMLQKRRGRIVNISSTSGQDGPAGQVNYAAAKAGLIGATKSLAKEVVKRNILVNAVAPGFIETDMTSGLPLDTVKAQIPMKRMGKAEEIASVVSFLCSEDSAYMTGQVLAVNGGIYM